MSSRFVAYGAALLVGAALTLVAPAQENAAEKAREQRVDTASQQNTTKEPHMAAALQHLRQAEEELEKAAPNKGGHRETALQQVQQAESSVIAGIQWYNQNVLKQK